MTAQVMEDEIIARGYQLQAKDRWAAVYFNSPARSVVCRLTCDYLPIEDFKSTFNKISELIINGDFEKFIFDKRSLRAFHQPSMEWYFSVWKKEMLRHGLTRHRKILPDEEWFRKAVQVARAELMSKDPENVVEKLDIRYCASLEEAFNS